MILTQLNFAKNRPQCKHGSIVVPSINISELVVERYHFLELVEFVIGPQQQLNRKSIQSNASDRFCYCTAQSFTFPVTSQINGGIFE